MALLTDSSLPLQEMPSFDCEDGGLPGQELLSQSSSRGKKFVVCFVVGVALCGFLVATGSCIQDEQCIQSLTNGLSARGRPQSVHPRGPAVPEPAPKAPKPAPEEPPSYALANLIFGVASLAVLTFLAPVATRGGNDSETGETVATGPRKRPRIDTLDSLRFFLIAYIASGHFISFATSNVVVLKLVSQINVVVGGFFVISGYVAVYTTTEMGERKYNAKRLDDTVRFAVTRIMGFVPLHLLVLLVFSPMFFWADAKFNGSPIAAWHGLISVTLTQAWFPKSAEVWNAPTWFLSAFAFCLVVLPHGLKVLALMTKSQLRRAIAFLMILTIIPKIAYSYDLGAWGIFEGMLNAKTHPNYAFFNGLRFSPLCASFEVLMGAAACRLVMLDTEQETNNSSSSLFPLGAMIAIIVLRAYDVIALNDMIVRSVIFIPLFICFLQRMHRETVSPPGKCKIVTGFLNFSGFVFLGSISFPIFIVHGPIGQLFYKSVVAKQLWGGKMDVVAGQWFFAVYWAVVLAAAYVCQKGFVENGKVKKLANDVGEAIACVVTGAKTEAAK